jgi:predicted nucleic acid-binding protein
MTLCDASPLFALVDTKQIGANARCKAALPTLSRPLITTWPAFTEAMYLVYREGGWPLQRLLWQYVLTGQLLFHIAGEAEQKRMAELMEQYCDIPMDFADASLVTAAETLNLSRIFTLDNDFYVYQRYGNQPFEVVP